MFPNFDNSPWLPELCLPRKAIVYDLVYNPPETHFVRQAREKGLMAVNGLGMLVEQAALADERWLGISPPRADMISAVPKELRGT